MSTRKVRCAWLWLSALVCALSRGAVLAGPVELLDGVSVSAGAPDDMVVTYVHGRSGLFVSEDGGATLKWLCAVGASLPVSNASLLAHASGDGSIYVGTYNGLWRGAPTGCGFAAVPELDKKYIRAIAGDPFEAQRTYVVTSNSMADNGIYMNDGGGSFVPLGTHAPMFIASLHVAKNGSARRFYETGVVTDLETNTVTFSVRVSDDDGESWTEHVFDPTPFEMTETRVHDFKVLTVDPTNPDRIVALLARSDLAPDALLLSAEQGKPGTWTLIASPIVGGAAAFASDGTLYFGDDNFANKGLFKVAQLGEPPMLLSDTYRVSCLGYDAARSRLLGCADNYRFGVFDESSGELATMLDLRCAEHVVTCADKPEIESLCKPPAVEFCKEDHWVVAPLCCVYDRPDFELFASSQRIVCEGGVAKPKPAGAVDYCPKADAGSGSAAGSRGDGAVGVAAGGPAPATESGCGCSSSGTSSEAASVLVLLALGLLWRGRHRPIRA